MRKGNVLDTLTSVDIQEKLKNGGNLIQFYKGVIYWEGFKLSHYWKSLENPFALRQKYKGKGNDVLQGLVILIMNRL